MRPFTLVRRRSVASLGEAGLIATLRQWLGSASRPAPRGIGDDCAVLPASKRARLVTIDPVIYGVHFDDRVPPRAAGAKLFKRNLSDIAAMGGRPRAAVVALALDGAVRIDWLEEFYRGLAAEGRRHRTPIVGGDIARLPGAFAATLTLIGDAGSRVLTRTGARIGDRIYVTGRLGRSLSTGHHHRFQPRLAEGAWLARRLAVRAMMDVSDGLATDLGALTPPGARAALDLERLPRRGGASVRAALADGEDYELLFALDRGCDAGGFERSWRRAFPRTPLSAIGHFVRGSRTSPHPVLAAGRPLLLERLHGYDHLR